MRSILEIHNDLHFIYQPVCQYVANLNESPQKKTSVLRYEVERGNRQEVAKWIVSD
jgi:hypothetical protein